MFSMNIMFFKMEKRTYQEKGIILMAVHNYLHYMQITGHDSKLLLKISTMAGFSCSVHKYNENIKISTFSKQTRKVPSIIKETDHYIQ